MNSAIIVAAGTGTRFGGDISKQFQILAGKPLFINTLAQFDACAAVNELILVVNANDLEKVETLCGSNLFRKPLRVVTGGEIRAQSVANGLAAVTSTAEIVAVHDGARPLIKPSEIELTIEAAREFGAACLVTAVTDTVKEVVDGEITQTINRDSLRVALTPQSFRLDLLRRAFAEAEISESTTDECKLVEALGVRIRAIEGSKTNIKITHQQDLLIAEALINAGYV
ncbi:MAG: 2-C-methyl-D-erythritol 4-phosphate cytidylyltransferase [Pyrinomonadaceae bacterium]